MSEKNLSQIVNEINEQLRAHGKDAVHEVKMTNNEGKTIGQVKYGYRPQYVFDAINELLFPENWRYEVLTKEIYDAQAVVEVKMFIRCSGEWFCKGSQVGQMNIHVDFKGIRLEGSDEADAEQFKIELERSLREVLCTPTDEALVVDEDLWKN